MQENDKTNEAHRDSSRDVWTDKYVQMYSLS